ncbi:MAG: ParB/RepB/Spo0J family partition protein [bacterium]
MPSIREKLADKKTKLSSPRHGPVEEHPADPNHFPEGMFLHIPVEEIQPNPDQPRQYFDPDSLQELAESIKERGVLQPVLVRRGKGGEIVLVAGERRLRAARMAGLERIPAMITCGNEAEIALIENLQREDLRPVEEAEALWRMVQEHGYTHEQLARVIGKARTTVTETLSLVRLPEEIREECRRADSYPRRLLVEIAKLPTQEEMIRLFSKVKEKSIKSEGVRDITRGRDKPRGTGSRLVKQIRALTKRLEKTQMERIHEQEKAEILRALRRLKAVLEDVLF